MRAQITLKSGAQIEFDVEDLTSGRTPLTGALVKLQWVTPADWSRKLHFIEMDQVAAIVMLQDKDPS